MIRPAPSAANLPSYEDPPVVEVAVSVQFEPIDQLSVAHLGLLWQSFRDEHPNVEVQPSLPRNREIFGPLPRAQRIGIQFEAGHPESRLWFLSEDGTRLVQVQHDRIAFNWRKLETDAAYPRYTQLREEFVGAFNKLAAFLAREGLDSPQADQAELTYVNLISGDEDWRSLPQHMRLWAGVPTPSILPEPEVVEFSTQFVFEEEDEPLGRLHIQFQPRLAGSQGEPVYRLQLVGRGAPRGHELEDVLKLLDLEHEWIVRGFTDITTEEMHRKWRRQR